MSKLDRRNFLRNFMFAGGAIALGRTVNFAADDDASTVRPFEMLALGDSVMWGQGLKDQEKFSVLTQNWLEREFFKNKRLVNLQVKAHSGAIIIVDRQKILGDPLKYYNGEINLWTPTIVQEADDALKCYQQPTNPDRCYNARDERLKYYKGQPVSPENVDLILVNGGINDFGAKRLVGTFPLSKEITTVAKACCYTKMNGLLKKLSDQFPRARIVVTGYFPLVSEKTDPNTIYEAAIQAFGTNPFTEGALKALKIATFTKVQQLYVIRNYLAKRSSIWYEESNKHLKNAVNEANNLFPIKSAPGASEPRVFFAKPDFKAENAYGAEKTFLWRLIDKTKTNDSLFDARKEICKEVQFFNDFDRFVCHRAGLFHPNTEGANAYFEAVKNELMKFM